MAELLCYRAYPVQIEGRGATNVLYRRPYGIFGQQVMDCYRRYIEFVADRIPSYKEFVQNMELKMQDEEFLEDVAPILRPEIHFDPHKAYSLVYEQLIDKMPGRRD